ncbi:cytochrome C biogenesis protein [Candidatus Woesearchaeota archaeon]|nr:cytochrome C biogenesis protein [Candidatus Woesearchaeota archaeon]
MAELTFFIAFLAGVISFFAPCVIPLVPAFLGYLSGVRFEQASRWTLLKHSLLFVLGFGAVFSVLGVLLNSLLSNVAYTVQLWLGRIAGVIIILFGFYLLGFIKPKFLMAEHKFKVHKFKSKELTSFVFGAAFAVGWTPCVGAVLGSILALAASMPGESLGLLLGYSLGLGIPFLIAGLFAQPFVLWLQRHETLFKYYNVVIGILVLTLGVLVFTGKLALIAGSFSFLNKVLL